MSAHKLKMTTVFVIHGISGSSQENWFPWLKERLESFGVKVIVLNFPDADNPKLGEWLDYFKQYASELDEDSIVIGHSLGVPFLLSVLEKQKVKAAFFVAGFCSLPDNGFKDKMKTFVKPFNWQKIKDNSEDFFVYHSDNDPYLPLSLGRELAEKVGSKVILVKGAGHFNIAAGYDKFELLLEKIKEMM